MSSAVTRSLQLQEASLEDTFDDIEKQLKELSSSSSLPKKKSSESSDQLGKKQKRMLRDAQQLLSRCRSQIDGFQLEVRQVSDESLRNAYMGKVNEGRMRLRKFQGELDWRRQEIQAAHQSAARNEGKSALFGGGSGGVGGIGGDGDHDAEMGGVRGAELGDVQMQQQPRAIAMGDRLQDKTEESLRRTLRMAHEAEAVGAKTLENMYSQEERMGRLHEDMDTIHDNLQRSKKLLGQLARGAASDRCVQILCAMITLALIIMIVLVATGADDGKLNAPDEVKGD